MPLATLRRPAAADRDRAGARQERRLVLLDEPLANLDYKLREELREELPTIFAASGAIFVYATTEPTEALLLGGNDRDAKAKARDAVRSDRSKCTGGRDRVDAARVFSDPPMNELAVEKRGALVCPATAVLPGVGALPICPTATIDLGFRADAVTLGEARPDAIALPRHGARSPRSAGRRVSSMSMSGSAPGCASLTGVHDWRRGAAVEVRVDRAPRLRLRRATTGSRRAPPWRKRPEERRHGAHHPRRHRPRLRRQAARPGRIMR